MSRTTYVTDPTAFWDVWVGPGPCPRTGRRFASVRWRNHYHAEAVRRRRPDLATRAELDWLRELTDSAATSADLDGIRTNLVGLRLGTSREAHGLLLARLADGVPVREIVQELRELDPANLELFS